MPRSPRLLLAALLLVSILFTACAHTRRSKKPSWMELAPEMKLNHFIAAGWEFNLGESLEEIQKNLGRPRSHTQDFVDPPHQEPGEAEFKDEIHILQYPGLFLRVYRTHERPPRDIILNLAITRKSYAVKWGLGVGAKKDKVVSELGRPREMDSESLFYELDRDTVEFQITRGIVTRVEWEHTID